MFSDNHKLTLTTSWDDGHPLDLRVAELLAKHGLRGTFYVPIENSRPTLTLAQIRELARDFEVGAHTVHHRLLTLLTAEQARLEILGSKRRLSEITGKPCSVFCFPSGRYAASHLKMLYDGGFSAARTVELLSLAHPHIHNGLAIIPTTLQAYPHSWMTYLRNATKRFRHKALWKLVHHIRGSDWTSAALTLLDVARTDGGVFHLWGHSWEIEATGQWQALERVFAAMAEASQVASCVTNSELCRNEGQAPE